MNRIFDVHIRAKKFDIYKSRMRQWVVAMVEKPETIR